MGLMLFCLRGMAPGVVWKEGLLRFAFWSINVGLLAMVVGSLLPVGLLQTWASVEHGYWFARSSEFLQTPIMEVLRWMRVPGDTLFALGAFALVWFVFRHTLGRPRPHEVAVERPEPAGLPGAVPVAMRRERL